MVTDPNAASPPSADVTAEWLDAHLPTVFSRHHERVMAAQRATIAAVIAEAGVKPGHTVLDVAGGSGIPTLALAERVGPAGKVVAAEPSPIFADAMETNLRNAGLTNVEVVRVSAAELPFAAGSFDAATCHMGVMFFPDVRAGLSRVRGVLRPGARAAFVAWGPDADNLFLGTFRHTVAPYLPPPPAATAAEVAPDPDPPRPDRFARPGSLSAALATAGFGDVREEAPMIDWTWPGPARSLVGFLLELTRLEPTVAPERREAMRTDLVAAYQRFADGDGLRVPSRMVVASGRA